MGMKDRKQKTGWYCLNLCFLILSRLITPFLTPYLFSSSFPCPFCQYFKYVFPDGVDTVIVKVNSDMTFPCSVMSIQDIQVQLLPLRIPSNQTAAVLKWPLASWSACSNTLGPHGGVIEFTATVSVKMQSKHCQFYDVLRRFSFFYLISLCFYVIVCISCSLLPLIC